MTAYIPQALMTLAINCLGADRHEWGLAMRGEFDLAQEDGRGLSFAAGCLAGALRQIPTHKEGRFTLASYAVAIGIIVPMAALFISSTLLGSAFVLNDGNSATAPALALLVVLLTGGHLLMGWVILERDWTRIFLFGRINAAATITLFMITGVIFLDETVMILPIVSLMIELTAALILPRWHGQFSDINRSTIAINL